MPGHVPTTTARSHQAGRYHYSLPQFRLMDIYIELFSSSNSMCGRLIAIWLSAKSLMRSSSATAWEVRNLPVPCFRTRQHLSYPVAPEKSGFRQVRSKFPKTPFRAYHVHSSGDCFRHRKQPALQLDFRYCFPSAQIEIDSLFARRGACAGN